LTVFRPDLFRTKVAGRILALFFVGAIVPVLLLAGLTFRAVSSQLSNQSEAQLRQLLGGSVQIMPHQLVAAGAWAEAVDGVLLTGLPLQGGAAPALIPSVDSLALEEGGVRLAAVGSMGATLPLSEAERSRLAGGAPILRTITGPGGSDVHLGVPSSTQGRVVWVDLVADSLWEAALILAADPRVSDLCVLDAESRPFVCKQGTGSGLPGAVPTRAERTSAGGVAGVVEVDTPDGRQIAAWRSIFLRSSFGVPEWLIVVSESTESVYAPVASFSYNLPLVLAVGLGLVFLLANLLVKRTMEPLVQLSSGTERIARHDLTARVEVGSDDEFGQLASSFNTMADRLSRQFRLIEAAAEVDRAVIEEGDASAASRALMGGIGELLPVDRAGLLLFDPGNDGLSILFQSDPSGISVAGVPKETTPDDLPWLKESAPYQIVTPNRVPEVFSAAEVGSSGGRVLIAPLAVRGTFVGAMALEVGADATWTDDDMAQALQLVHQASVALNELRLRRETLEMGWEALGALAIAIDAKSQWTSGHSERVSELATGLAGRLELSIEQRDLLHRGGLLHDIGKIGVSTEVLDYPGKLDDAMRQAIEAHPAIGARILEPIKVFRPLIPIVRHHHERWDGKGYPDGLAGTDIPYLARILAVADVYDAMKSARPYRPALSKEIVLEHILEGAGSAFDPELVEPFHDLITSGWTFDSPGRANVR
jgi:putative nucleotidyltransferase with HDIG domain